MPTIRDNNNFDYSFKSIDMSSPFYDIVKCQCEIFGNINVYNFLLASSMLSYC